MAPYSGCRPRKTAMLDGLSSGGAGVSSEALEAPGRVRVMACRGARSCSALYVWMCGGARSHGWLAQNMWRATCSSTRACHSTMT